MQLITRLKKSRGKIISGVLVAAGVAVLAAQSAGVIAQMREVSNVTTFEAISLWACAISLMLLLVVTVSSPHEPVLRFSRLRPRRWWR